MQVFGWAALYKKKIVLWFNI